MAFDLEFESPTEVRPTVRERIHVYDLIRGVAILGILLANIPYFAGPGFTEELSLKVDLSGVDGLIEKITSAFVSGKFRSTLAILFGIGIWLQFQKRSQIHGNWPGGYLKRTLILACFGLVHGIFIWFGDILFLYACVAFVMCLAAGFSDRVLAWIAGSLLGLGFLLSAGLTVWAALSPPDLSFEGADPLGLGLTVQREIAVFGSGSYWDQLVLRSIEFGLSVSSFVGYFPFLAGLFAAGILLGKHGVLATPQAHRKACIGLLLVGVVIGLPFNLLAFAPWDPNGFFLFSQAVELSFASFLSAGLAAVLAIWAQSGWFAPVQRSIARVGRTAFSNYILQSLICTFIFYSWGLGWFGKLDRLGMFYVVATVWAANLLFAHFWLKKYAMGPLEWLWRSWTEGKRLEM